MTNTNTRIVTRYNVVVDYDYSTYKRGDVISTHASYAAANRKASQSTFWRIEIRDTLQEGTNHDQ